MRITRSGRTGAVTAAGVLAVGTLVWVGAVAAPGPADTASLGGPERYLTSIATDKPVYRPGETVYVRGVLLHAATHRPLPDRQPANALVEVRGPKGEVVASGQVASADSVWAFAWEVPAEQAGGSYTAKVNYPWHGYAPAERRFDVRVYRAPRLRSQIVFLRDGYGPGDRVTATLHTERAEGGFPTGAKVSATARVDGTEVGTATARVDAQGNATVSLDLPKAIARGEGSLACAIEDGGVIETAAKTIPILLQTVDLTLYPEGGDLVAGLENRVYFEARTPAGKPGDIAGVVVDAAGAQAGRFRSEHEGRGRFTFTPAAGGRYSLRITEPSGIRTAFPLSEVKPEGAVLRAVADLTAAREPVVLQVASRSPAPLTVTLRQREVEVATAALGPAAGAGAQPFREVRLDPRDADGVLIATVWDAKGTPLAERLVFRQPAAGIKVEITPDRKTYVPGDAVALTVRTLSAAGRPTPAVVGVAVTDDSVLEMIETREQAPRLPVMVLLEPEVRELADAAVYLDPANAKAPLAVDLLLGTQGWRRFALANLPEFLAKHGEAGRRALAVRVETPRMMARAAGAMRRKGGGPEGGEMLAFGMVADGAPMAGALPPPAPMAAPAQAPNEAAMMGAPAGPVPVAARDQPPPAAAPLPALRPVVAGQAVAAKEMPARPAAPEPQARAELRQAVAKAEELADKDRLIAADEEAPVGNLSFVREYAHPRRAEWKPADRVDFAETLFWQAALKTDAKGEARVRFDLSDAVTSFRVLADAFGATGALGSGKAVVESVQPFYLEPKVPLEITAGDRVRLPVSFVNGTAEAMSGVRLTATAAAGVTLGSVPEAKLGPGERVRRLLDLAVGSATAPVPLVLAAQAGPYSDKVTRTVAVRPPGFPVETNRGGMLDARTAVGLTVTVPPSVVENSGHTSASVYPTPLANLTAALERLIQDPCGCFEQTSSTCYPLVMAQQYFLSHTGIDPALVRTAQEKLDNGYKKLAGFECKERGYEWFGGDPGHEALTAYGLLEFSDMAQVREVDKAMLERTRAWLLARRDGQGSFRRDGKALDSFGRAPAGTTDAYIVWSLLEAGEKGLEKEVAATLAAAQASADSYVVALGANIAALAGDTAAAKTLREKLMAKQGKDGGVAGAQTSITCSGGESLTIETTSLAILAWLRDPNCAAAVETGIKFLADSCQAGRFGSTQATVLALRAIVTYDKARARPTAPGRVRLFVDGNGVGSWTDFTPETRGAIALPDAGELLTPGAHTLELRMENGSPMPCSLTATYHALTPTPAPACRLELAVALRQVEVTEGKLTEAVARVTNRTQEACPMAVAIVGLPGGLEPRHDQLKELVKQGTIAAYEVIGRNVVLYWRQLLPSQRIEVPLSLLASVPGTYTGPASRAYLYYTDEHKAWVDPLKVTVTPRG